MQHIMTKCCPSSETNLTDLGRSATAIVYQVKVHHTRLMSFCFPILTQKSEARCTQTTLYILLMIELQQFEVFKSYVVQC